MTEWFHEIQRYLPKYLSKEAQEKLFSELDQFPANIDSRVYTSRLGGEMTIFQGDGLSDLWVADLPSARIQKSRVMVLSNSCDVSSDNKRIAGPRLLYCPVVAMSKYEALIRETAGLDQTRFSNHVGDIRRQMNTSMFYLPNHERLGGEGIALLDRINNCDAQAIDLAEAVAGRLFTLSDYGFYLFLFKLSIHLTRIREGVSRS